MDSARNALIAMAAAIVAGLMIGDGLHSGLPRGEALVSSAKAQTPSETCASARSACLRAHAREGQFGSRYVPPGEGVECEAAYQQCLKPDRCTLAEKACLRGAARATSTGAAYVPPEDAARCHAAYEACVSDTGSQNEKDSRPPAATDVDISGSWGSNIGVDYNITQTGKSFRWVVTRGIPGETANGRINGDRVSATWSGPNSHGSASGVVKGRGRPTRIEWSNGVVFLRR